MNPRKKNRPSDKESPAKTTKPLRLNDAGNQAALSNAASRRVIAAQLASGAANHARHHVSRQTQS